MKKLRNLIKTAAAALALAANAADAGSDTANPAAGFRAGQYNVRVDAANDAKTGNAWAARKKHVVRLILEHGFDVFGVQEPNDAQLGDLVALLPGFGHAEAHYAGRSGKSHNAAIFYKTEKFELLDSGRFYFSETPDLPSNGWEGDHRVCNWTRLRHKPSAREFFFFNAHFYWKGTIAREKSGPLMAAQIKKIAGDSPVIAVGDYNSTPGTPQIGAIKTVLADTRDVALAAGLRPRGPEKTSFHGGVFEGDPVSRIDYIFISPHFAPLDHSVIDDKRDEVHYPSDHFPVTTLLRWK